MSATTRAVTMKAIGWSLLFATAVLLSGERASAALYRWVDDKGEVHVTDDVNSIPETHRPQMPAAPAGPKFRPATPEDLGKGRAAIEPLKTLRLVADAGVTYQSYMTRLGDARIDFDRAGRGMRDSSLRDALASAMAFYQLAGAAWSEKIQGGNPLLYAGGPAPRLQGSTEVTIVSAIFACAEDKVAEANTLLR
jgi:Domain of unknown function (DUF4124)